MIYGKNSNEGKHCFYYFCYLRNIPKILLELSLFAKMVLWNLRMVWTCFEHETLNWKDSGTALKGVKSTQPERESPPLCPLQPCLVNLN